jgi:hypothetical protein
MGFPLRKNLNRLFLFQNFYALPKNNEILFYGANAVSHPVNLNRI